MHENEISSLIIGAAIEVHRYYGPGLVEHFHAAVLKDGISRVVNDLAEYEPPPIGSFRI